MIKVFLADDHAIIRDGVRRNLDDATGFSVCGESADGHDLVAKVRSAGADVVVLDMNMPGPPGLQLIRTLVAVLPHVKLLVFTSQEEDHFAMVALKNGAHGFLNKEHPPHALMEAIRTVYSGRRSISAKMAQYIVARELDTDTQGEPHATLSPREYDVFIQLARGHSPSVVAANMTLTRSTVSTYVQRLKRKLGLHSVAEMVSYAHRHQLIE